MGLGRIIKQEFCLRSVSYAGMSQFRFKGSASDGCTLNRPHRSPYNNHDIGRYLHSYFAIVSQGFQAFLAGDMRTPIASDTSVSWDNVVKGSFRR